MKNKHYLLALNRINGIGPRTMMKLLSRWPDLEELFRLSPLDMEQLGLPKALISSLITFNFDEIEADLRWQAASHHHHLLTWGDPIYPDLLKEIADPPPVLYAMGDLSSLKQPTVAMVGTRKPSVTGSETARRFAFELAQHQVTIVSGLALGIDAQAHMGCLEANGRTIAVMGTGIDCIYPSRHRHLSEKICANGMLISQFPLKSPPIAGHFPLRNRIICGLSLCTLVVEAAIRSGSLITARLALEQNRDVLAVPGSIYNMQASGCNYLLQQGAKLVTTTQDVLEELRIDSYQGNQDLVIDLATGNRNLVKFIGFELTSIDQIVKRSGMNIEKIVCDLVDLELHGMIKAVPGGYMRCTA